MASQAKKIVRPDDRGSIGRTGEELAAAFLERAGFTIVVRNWRCRLGEIDLIVERSIERGKELRFVEVKTRRGTTFGYPEESVSYSKRQHLFRALECWLQMYAPNCKIYQVDVISVLLNANPPTIDWFQNISLV